jgi:PhoH-like ATPase
MDTSVLIREDEDDLSNSSLTPKSEITNRIYVLDTNVLLYDPGALYVFHEHDVTIPLTVIEELDNFKKDLNETGRNARTVSRYLDDLRTKGALREGVQLENGGLLKVDFFMDEGHKLPISWGPLNNDNRILQCVLHLDRQFPGRVVLVTRDTNMRLKCDALGVRAEDYQHSRLEVDEQYTGLATLDVDAQIIDAIYQSGHINIESLEVERDFNPNQFVMLQTKGDSPQTAMTRFEHQRGRLKLVGRHKEGVWGIFARNKEQLFALELLLDPSLKLVTLNGVAGTGKTLMALACGLKQAADDQLYRKVLVSRPIFPLGRDIGFLPGDIEEKLNPWMKPIFDNLELLVSTAGDVGRGKANGDPQYQYLLDKKIMEVEPLTYIRGRSIPQQFLIVDEAQNLTPHEVKTILTRAGEGTKVIMTGDPYQIDNPYVDALSNGLTYTVERFKESELAGHITLKKGERSELAEMAAKLL